MSFLNHVDGVDLAHDVLVHAVLAELVAYFFGIRVANWTVTEFTGTERPRNMRALLLDGEGRPIPALVREGRPLAAGERVEDGDRIELVWVVPGG